MFSSQFTTVMPLANGAQLILFQPGGQIMPEFENEKKKGQKYFDLPERGYEPNIFRKIVTETVVQDLLTNLSHRSSQT
jgi:hypothetical protein